MNNYETTGSDKFCKFDREMSKKIEPFHNYNENIWLENTQLIKFSEVFALLRNVVSEFLISLKRIYLSEVDGKL